MANGLKVRLDDGSEVGPLELRMLQTWFQQGLISPDSMVQKPGNPRWVKLSEATNLREWGPPPTLKPRGRGIGRGPSPALLDSGPEVAEGGWRLRVASVLLFVLALGAGFAVFWPDRVRPDLDGTPWVQVGLGLGALALALLPRWDLARKAVRVVCLLGAGAAFPLAGVFVAKGMRGEALLVLASAWLLAAGLVAFLGPALSRLASAASLLLVLLGIAGLVRYAAAEPSSVPALAQWASGERKVTNDEIGLTLTAPAGWTVLKPANTLVPVPASGRATLAQPRVGGYAFLLVEPAPAGVLQIEHYLDHVVAQRRGSASAFDEEWRRDGRLGQVESRRASLRRVSAEGRFVERAVVARDGDRYFALVAWVPESAGGRALEEIDALEAAVTLSGVRDAGRRAAVQQANLELPHLSVGAIQRLVESGGPGTPAELFRRSVAASARGLSSLGPAGSQELQALTTAALALLPKKERAQLVDYLGRAGAGQPTHPEEDEPMRVLMKAAASHLGTAQRTRMGELNEAAIGAGGS
jgi:hypothetical protein